MAQSAESGTTGGLFVWLLDNRQTLDGSYGDKATEKNREGSAYTISSVKKKR